MNEISAITFRGTVLILAKNEGKKTNTFLQKKSAKLFISRAVSHSVARTYSNTHLCVHTPTHALPHPHAHAHTRTHSDEDNLM